MHLLDPPLTAPEPVTQTLSYELNLIDRAAIDLEPKIRTAEEILIILPKNKMIVSVCTTNVRSYLCLFIFRNHLLQQCLLLDFFLVIVTENVFFACSFLEVIKC